jgi:hypothetical protein
MHTKGRLYRAHSLQPIELEMKALQLALRIVVAGLLLLALAFASYRAGFNARCQTGNMGGPFSPDNIKAEHYFGFDWARHALTCSMGDYQVVTPAGPGRGEGGYILRKSRPIFAVNNKETDLFDDSSQHLLFSLTRATAERDTAISYSTYDQAQGAWIENFDFHADGTLDYRTTKMNGRKVKQEFRVGEHWLEVVQQDGRTGVVFSGRFMPVADAIKLGAKSKADDK